MATLADLIVNFGANSAELRKAMKTVQSDLHHFTKQVDGMKNTLRHAFEAVGAAFLAEKLRELVTHGNELSAEMAKLAVKSGLAVETISALSYAARMSEVQIESLATGIKFLSKNVTDAAGGGKFAAIFDAINVSAKNADGSTRNVKDVLLDLSEVFRALGDSPERAALAVKLFGRNGIEMIPFLARGKEGITELMEEAQRLGLVLDTETAEGAHKLEQSITRLKIQTEMFTQHLTAQLAPALVKITEEFARHREESTLTGTVIAGVSMGFRVLGMILLDVSTALIGMGKAAVFTVREINAIGTGNWDQVKPIYQEYQEGIDRLGESFERLKAAINAVPEPPPAVATTAEALSSHKPMQLAPAHGPEADALRRERAATELRKRVAGALGGETDKAASRAAKSLKDYTQALDKLGDALSDIQTKNAEVARGFKDEVADVEARLDTGDLSASYAALKERAPEAAEAYRKSMLAAAKEARDARLAQDALTESIDRMKSEADEIESIYLDVRTPAQAYADTMARLNYLFESGAFMPDIYARAVERVKQAYADAHATAKAFIETGVNGMLNLYRAALDGSASIKDVWRDLLENFISMCQRIIAEWVATQIVLAAGQVAGGAAGGGGAVGSGASPGGTMAKAPPPAVTAAAVAAGTGGTEVNLYVNAVDAHSFTAFLRKNETALADSINRLAYKGRI